MKLGNKEKNLLIGLLGIVIAAAVWMLVASPMRDKTEALKNENAALKITKDEYEAVNAQRKVYEQGITDLTTEREELLSAFPSGMIREDEIMYWANMERSNSGQIALSSIIMSNWEEVYADPEAAKNKKGDKEAKEGDSKLRLFKAPVNYQYVATYDGIKGMVKYVFAQKDKKSIEGINIAYDDSTGNLTGTMDVNMYYMMGTDNEFEPMTIPTVPTGVTNVFRTTNTNVVTEADGVSEFAGEEGSEEATE